MPTRGPHTADGRGARLAWHAATTATGRVARTGAMCVPAATQVQGLPITELRRSVIRRGTCARVVGGLADRWYLYAPDLRGHDRSGRPGAYSFDLMREDALGLMDVLGLGRVSLVGHSLGGVVAYLLAESGHVPHGLELGAVGPMPWRDDWGQRAAAGVRTQVGLGGERAARAAQALTSCITSTRRGRRGCATATRPGVLPVRPPLPWRSAADRAPIPSMGACPTRPTGRRRACR
ncbi:alpha/beta hydrolase [Streptomyces mirabilis]|uniref:alpha/beta hydrolase n=2 Tax=Streptomyces mirabilis TaxID=68239 RepID=UPI0036AD4DEE